MLYSDYSPQEDTVHYYQEQYPLHHQQQQQLIHHHNNNSTLPSLLPPSSYNSYFPPPPPQDHKTDYFSRDYSLRPNLYLPPYPQDAVTDPSPSTQSHGPSNTALPYVQNLSHLNVEERPLPPSFPNDTSRHLYQHQPHYRYPSTLSSAPPMNASLPSWSGGASETGSGYGGLAGRPPPEATFANNRIRESEEPPFPHEYLSEPATRSSYPYAQPYPFYHGHGRENPTALAQDRSHWNIQSDNHFTTHAHREQSHYRHYRHAYEPPPTSREGAPSPPATIPSLSPYNSQRWHESTDRRDNNIGHRGFDKSTTFRPLPSISNLTNPKPVSLKRNLQGELQSSCPQEITNQYRSPPSSDPNLHCSTTLPEDETRRYSVTPHSSAESLTELANASLLTTHISKSTTMESAYPSPSSSTFSEKPFTFLTASPMSQGSRRDQYTQPNHACHSCGGSNVELVGDEGTYPCKDCGKPPKHNTDTTTQQLDHTSIRKEPSPLSESEIAQILDAASILFTIKSTTVASSSSSSSSISSTTTSTSLPPPPMNTSRASTPGTITQPSSPHLDPKDILPSFSIPSLLLVDSTDAGSSVKTKLETRVKEKGKGRKVKRRKVSA